MSGSAASFPHALPSGVPFRVFGDDRLVRLAAQGNQRAFATLYERHHQTLYRYCRSIVRDEQDAQDVLQTTMAKAFAALSKGAPDAPLRPWLFRIARNESISALRARKPTVELDAAAHLSGPSVEGRAEERARLDLLVSDLGELPERQRSALVMRELSGLSHVEIGTALGVSPSGAKQAILDARVGLAEFAKGREMACADVQRVISDADGRALRGRQVRAHLRACGDCRGLRDAIARRRADLAAIAAPLPPAVAAGLFARLFGGGSGHAGGGGVSASTAATAGKVTTVGLAGKLATGAVVLMTVSLGAPKLIERTPHGPAQPQGRSASTVHGTAAAASNRSLASTTADRTTVPRSAGSRAVTGDQTGRGGAKIDIQDLVPTAGRSPSMPTARGGTPATTHKPTWAGVPKGGTPQSGRGPSHSGRPAKPKPSSPSRPTTGTPGTVPPAGRQNATPPPVAPKIPTPSPSAGGLTTPPTLAGGPPTSRGTEPVTAPVAHPHG